MPIINRRFSREALKQKNKRLTQARADHEHVRSTSVLEPAGFNMTSWSASLSTTDFFQVSVDRSFGGRTQIMLIIIRKHLVDILERERRPNTDEDIDFEHVRSSWFSDPTNTHMTAEREFSFSRVIFWAMDYIPFSSFILSASRGQHFFRFLDPLGFGIPSAGQGWWFPRLWHSLCQARDDTSLGWHSFCQARDDTSLGFDIPSVGPRMIFPSALAFSLSGQGWYFPRLRHPSALFDHWPCWWHDAWSNDETHQRPQQRQVLIRSDSPSYFVFRQILVRCRWEYCHLRTKVCFSMFPIVRTCFAITHSIDGIVVDPMMNKQRCS